MSPVAENAVVLVSGGLDSATTLAIARDQGYRCYAISFDYGQRHRIELTAADTVARTIGAEEHRVVPIDLSAFGGSALTDLGIDVPEADDVPEAGDVPEADDVPEAEKASSEIPVTYVPARNTVFLSLALAWAEVLDARHIFIGVNAVDYSGYPDCRPEFIKAFEVLANLATKTGVEGGRFAIHTPLIDLSKAEIIRRGMALKVDYSLTISCYQPSVSGAACGRCDSCRLRRAGFVDAGLADPTQYSQP